MFSTKTATVTLTLEQVDMLRGVLYEYKANFEMTDLEEDLRLELEEILADAEDEIYLTSKPD